jgi:predicted dehydrogenase
MLNIGIIGFGKMGKLRASMVEATGKGRVRKVYDPGLTSHERYLVAADAEEIIADPTLDAVIVCTPNFRNKDLTIQALGAGKHVLCEKPPAFTSDDVREIMAAEKASGLKLMYGFNHRHHKSVRSIKTLLDSGKYGRILWMRGRYGKNVDDNYFATWRARKELVGGGILLDQGIHMLDLFLMLGGGFDEVQAMVSSLFWKIDGVEDNVFANFRNSQTGVVASLHSTMTQWRHLFSLEVFLEHGYFVLNGLKTQSGAYGDEVLTIAKNRSDAPSAKWQDEERIVFDTDTSWADETSAFLDHILLRTQVQTGSSRDALAVMELIDKIYSFKRMDSHHLRA